MKKATEKARQTGPICKPLPFQKGDKVTTPRGQGVVTAVGGMAFNGVRLIPTYRVGRNTYWSSYQLRKRT